MVGLPTGHAEETELRIVASMVHVSRAVVPPRWPRACVNGTGAHVQVSSVKSRFHPAFLPISQHSIPVEDTACPHDAITVELAIQPKLIEERHHIDSDRFQ